MSVPESASTGMMPVPGEVALLALVGSHAYGTNRPDSDEDRRGVFVAPTHRVLSLRPPAETVDRSDPDVTIHELRKFLKLAAAANPTVLEVLWADSYEATADGELLRRHRSAFLSRRVMQTYGGYARQQLAKAQRGVGGSRGVKHFQREKFVLHLYRLMECGIHVLRTGDLKLRVNDPADLWERARQPLDAVEREFDRMDEDLRLAATATCLPEHPDIDVIDGMLLTIRDRNR